MADEEPVASTSNGEDAGAVVAPDEEDDAPPGFGPPPGLGGAKRAPGAVDALAASMGHVLVDGDAPDEPDLSLRPYEGLQEDPDREVKAVVADDTIYKAAQTFEDLGLTKELLQGLYSEMGFERPSRVQASTLPMILMRDGQGVHRDLIAQAHNGSGKTTCFVLAMLSRVDPALKAPQALCMCPTRELVVQNLQVLQKMAKYTTLTAISTASDEGPRRDVIRDQVVIGTHGKLKNWVTKRLLDVDVITILVFDEADEMLKADAFADDSVRLIKTIRKRNPSVQLLLFSATFNDKIKAFALRISPNANQVFIPKEKLSLDVIKQYIVRCPGREAKTQVLKDMIFPNCEKLGQTIIFVRTKEGARQLHATMEAEGYKCTSIQSDMDHAARDRTVREFREGTTKILISTDVLSRGFDVSQVTLVVNYDPPTERDRRTPGYETYLHRIGRSGRFGRKGAAFNLVASEEDAHIMHAIADYFKKNMGEMAADDEDAFITALNAAGLTEQVA